MKDVSIIGAGPGGSTLATLLAQKGYDVVLLEKESFPRFKIGESLLPKGNAILKQSGVWPKIEAAGFPQKWAAEFTCHDGEKRVHNIFAEGMIPDLDYTYQVERAQFDQILLDHAKASGVKVMQPVAINSIHSPEKGKWDLRIKDSDGIETTVTSRFLADASGRSRVLARHLNIPTESINLPNRLAVFSHFTGMPRNEDKFAGDIRIVRIPNGWFWIIPIDEHKTSVGLVFCSEDRKKGNKAEQFFREKVGAHPLMSRLMADAEAQIPFKTDSDFSYIHSTFSGDDFLLLGDAAAFLDPVFSSGVYLTLESASIGAEILSKSLEKGKLISSGQQRHYERHYRKRLSTMEALIQVFYDDRQFPVFMNPRSTLKLAEAVNSVVAGNSMLGFPLWWRYELFLKICRFNRSHNLVPPVAL